MYFFHFFPAGTAGYGLGCPMN